MSYAQETTDNIRRDQIAEARRLADSERESAATAARTRPVLHIAARGSRTVGAPEKKKNVLKGHEAFLKALEMNHARIEVEKKDGTLYRGTLKHTDKYTITLNVDEQGHVEDGDAFSPVEARDRVIFKHDMSEFSALTQRPAATEGNQ